MYVFINIGFKNNFLMNVLSFILSLGPHFVGGTESRSSSLFYTIVGSVLV